jgi:hypothetical protein
MAKSTACIAKGWEWRECCQTANGKIIAAASTIGWRSVPRIHEPPGL